MADIESWCRTERIDCLYWLVPAAEWSAVGLAEEHGFCLVDVRVTLAWQSKDEALASLVTVGSGCSVRLATTDDVTRLRKIARVNHRATRFYNDPGFSMERCDALYDTWIRKSCEEGYADAVFVGEVGGTTIGYLTCHLDPDRYGRIGLVGLASEARGRGFGRRLVRAAQEWFVAHDRSVVTVASQARNRDAQRFYQRCGFLTHDTALWFHRWFSYSS